MLIDTSASWGRRGRRWVGLAAVAAVTVAGCTTAPEEPGGDGRLRVIATVYPLADAAERIGGPQVDVRNLTPAGAEAHDLELSSRQVDDLEDADVVLFVGGGFQPAVEAAVEGRTGGTVDVTDGLDLAPGEGATDPHFWLDPTLLATVAASVGSAMVAADPDGRAELDSNLATYRADLEALDRRFATGLADCERREIVTTHAAFSYLAARYDLVQRPITGLSPESEPEPGRLAELRDLIAREGITTVFTEELLSPDLARTLAREAGVRTATLDPLEGLTPDRSEAAADYFTVMDDNLAALRAALGCR